MVDLPEAERPVNQIVRPLCLRRMERSVRESEGCHVMLVALLAILGRWEDLEELCEEFAS